MSDITKHKWSDSGVWDTYIASDGESLVVDFKNELISVTKQDAIAIAEHFGLIDSFVKKMVKDLNDWGSVSPQGLKEIRLYRKYGEDK